MRSCGSERLRRGWSEERFRDQSLGVITARAADACERHDVVTATQWLGATRNITNVQIYRHDVESARCSPTQRGAHPRSDPPTSSLLELFPSPAIMPSARTPKSVLTGDNAASSAAARHNRPSA